MSWAGSQTRSTLSCSFASVMSLLSPWERRLTPGLRDCLCNYALNIKPLPTDDLCIVLIDNHSVFDMFIKLIDIISLQLSCILFYCTIRAMMRLHLLGKNLHVTLLCRCRIGHAIATAAPWGEKQHIPAGHWLSRPPITSASCATTICPPQETSYRLHIQA